MGFSFKDVKKIMEEKIQTSGSNYSSLEVLVADLVNAQKGNTQDESSQTSLQKGIHGCFLKQGKPNSISAAYSFSSSRIPLRINIF
jgi:hypothetical protein